MTDIIIGLLVTWKETEPVSTLQQCITELSGFELMWSVTIHYSIDVWTKVFCLTIFIQKQTNYISVDVWTKVMHQKGSTPVKNISASNHQQSFDHWWAYTNGCKGDQKSPAGEFMSEPEWCILKWIFVVYKFCHVHCTKRENAF